MNVLASAIPDVDVLLELEPEELGAKLLFIIKREMPRDLVAIGNLTHDLWPVPDTDNYYPSRRKGEVEQALREA